MANRFNSGMGGNTCDRCSKLLCAGFFPKPVYCYTASADKHYVVVSSASSTNPPGGNQRHIKDFCAECAALITIMADDEKLVTAKELYNL